MNNYKIDTHVHTSEVSSCGKVPAADVARLYKEQNYDAIVITDHYYSGYFDSLFSLRWEEKIDSYLEGYRIAKAEGEKIGLKVLLGIEMRFDIHPNDYLIYGVDEEFLYRNPEMYRMTPEKFTRFKEGKGLAVFQAHPFRARMEIERNEYLDGIEVMNGNPRHDSNNCMAYNHALSNNLRMLSGSDFHQLPDLARGGLFMEELPESSTGFADYMLKNKIVDLIGVPVPCG
ncbi:MAG: PHP domain-containing protein [Spirochaetia bacterium]|nr:PHP domain-containing protein [Spirochaetia bacterium]